jgi:hypothetical protein
MLRVFLTIVLPLLVPSALYLLWVGAFGWWREEGSAVSWAAMPWIWLAAAGAVLLAVVLFVVTVGFGVPQKNGTYVPPRWQNGHIVPGHVAPGHVVPKPGP